MNNIAEFLINTANLYENKIAFTDKSGTVTYRELLIKTKKIAQWLTKNGIGQNDKVGIALYDSINLCAAFFATVMLGAVAVMTNPRGRKENLLKQLSFVGTDLVLIEGELIGAFDGAELKTALIKDVAHESMSLTEYDQPIATVKESIAFLLFTSGTTGSPMAVSWVHGTVIDAIKSRTSALDLNSGDRVYCTGKIYSSYGMTSSMLGSVANGGESFLESGLSTPMAVKTNILNYKPNKFFSVPLIYNHFINKKDENIPEMKCYSSGYHASNEVTDGWRMLTGGPLGITFGMTESLAFLCNNDGTNDLGFPMDGFEVRIADDDDNEVADGVIGNLQCRSSIKGLNYYNRPIETAKKFKEWMNSGDLAYRTSDGRFHYVNRATDIITVNGQFVNPIDIEETIEKFPGIGQVAVVGKMGKNNIEQVEAYIVLDKGITIDTVGLKKWVISKHEKYACPRVYHIVDELPKTDNGKIQKYFLKNS